MGQGTNAIGVRSTVVGQGAKAELGNAVAVGQGAQTLGINATTIGKGAFGGEIDGVTIGHLASTGAADAVIIGADASVSRQGEGGIAIGRRASVVDSLLGASARSIGAIAIGLDAEASGPGAIAIGHDVSAGVDRFSRGQIRIGNASQTDVWIGRYDLNALFADQFPDESPPRRPDAPRPPIQSGISDASVQGAEAKAESPIASAGIHTTSFGGSINGGDRSRIGGLPEQTALGYNASARGRGATAIGANASATRGGIAIGAGVTTGDTHEIVIGDTGLRAVRIGRFDLGTDLGKIDDAANATGSAHARINYNRDEIADLKNEIGSIKRSDVRYNKGIAMAMAQQFLPVEKGSRARFGMTSSGYRGEFGIGVSAGVRLTDRIQLHLSGAADTGFDEKAFKTGFDIQFK